MFSCLNQEMKPGTDSTMWAKQFVIRPWPCAKANIYKFPIIRPMDQLFAKRMKISSTETYIIFLLLHSSPHTTCHGSIHCGSCYTLPLTLPAMVVYTVAPVTLFPSHYLPWQYTLCLLLHSSPHTTCHGSIHCGSCYTIPAMAVYTVSPVTLFPSHYLPWQYTPCLLLHSSPHTTWPWQYQVYTVAPVTRLLAPSQASFAPYIYYY